MREIKFRAWDSERNIMKRPSVNMMIDTFNGTCYWQFGYDISLMGKLELMQYTGLKDKNGKEIYHKDIVRYYEELWTVEWNENSSSFEVLSLDKNEVMAMGDSRMEIIGNIYENPELLKRHC